jgi:tripartite-type tricarboxylate transporter receptor subunit TctC
MLKTLFVFAFTGLSAVATAQTSGAADSWPNKPIRVFVPFPPGGGTDFIGREVTNRIGAATKWTFVVDNRPGAGGNIGIDAVAKSPADGYSIAVGQTSNLAINPTLYAKLPYDAMHDLTPIGLIGYSPLAIVVSASSPFKTLAEVIAAAKAKPGTINYATSGNGTVAHLATEMLQKEAGVKLVHIPYRGASQGMNDVIGGQVELYVSSIPTLLPQIKAGKLRPLAVTSLKRSDDLAQVPTVAESGYKGFDAVTWFGLVGPGKLPANIVNSLNKELNKALALPELKKKLEDQGVDIAPGSADAFTKLIRSETTKWGRIVKESGAKAD